MARWRPQLIALGVALILTGALWIGQGLGYVHWPRSSFMIDDRMWAEIGAAFVAVGALLIVLARRRR